MLLYNPILIYSFQFLSSITGVLEPHVKIPDITQKFLLSLVIQVQLVFVIARSRNRGYRDRHFPQKDCYYDNIPHARDTGNTVNLDR